MSSASRATLVSIGTAVPSASVTQEETLAVARRLYPHLNGASRAMEGLFRRTSIKRRGTVLVAGEGRGATGGGVGTDLPRAAGPWHEGPRQEFFGVAPTAEFRGPGTASRLARYALEAAPLAVAAGREALERGGVLAREVTHLVTVSCTGFGAPGVDADVIRGLGLAPTVQRTHIGFMGCHGAINGLRVARAFAEADAAAVVLVVCVELCSLHFQYGNAPDQMVANALFADGAAAAVVRGDGPGTDLPRAAGPWHGGLGRLASTASVLLPGSAEAMTWTVGDHGFEMTLSPRVPDLIRENLRGFVSEWLGGCGVAVGEVGSWAIHPGGPRVISTVVESLGLPDGAAGASRRVMAERGNMSSPTVLFILRELLEGGGAGERAGGGGLPAVGLAFGPGLVIEAFLLTK